MLFPHSVFMADLGCLDEQHLSSLTKYTYRPLLPPSRCCSVDSFIYSTTELPLRYCSFPNGNSHGITAVHDRSSVGLSACLQPDLSQ
jgi:hypothetical protein